jgi:two-component system NarL family sensor kinase
MGDPLASSQGAGLHRLRKKIVLLAILPLLVSLLLIALTVRHQAQDLARRERQQVEAAYLASKEAELRGYLDLANSMVGPIYASGRDDEQAKAEAVRILNSLRYSSGDGYFFAYDYSGHCIVLPPQPELVGQDLWEVRDPNGVPVVQALVAQARKGHGYFRYLWNKPSTRQVAPKLGYVMGLERWGWMIGTGLYLDDIQATLDQLERQGSANISATMGWISLIALLAIVLVGGSALALNLSEHRAADAQLKLMARHVVQSQELERAHLSRELHDSTSQTLVSIKLLMDSALRQLQRGDQPVPANLGKARQRLDEALAEVRNISHRLRPALLDTLGLPSALKQMGEEFTRNAGLGFVMRLRGAPDELPEAVKTVLFRITQEALNNIDKHAQATRVDLRLIYLARGVRLSILDDGEGFDVDAMQHHPHRGIGLRNMQERLESIGGHLRIRSRPGSTRVIAEVPAKALARQR